MDTIRWLGSLILIVSPGCWLALLSPFAPYSFATRLALAVVLSPLVTTVEFYVLRWFGLPFEVSAVVLLGMNTPALVLLLGKCRPTLPPIRPVLLWSAFLALPTAFILVWMGNAAIRASHGHAWLHSAISYLLANGQLRPEDPHLAGIPMAYPWLSHVSQSAISFVAGSPPNVSYLTVGAVWLGATFVFVAAIVARLGGDRLAQASSSAWLCFAVNIVGVTASRWLPSHLVARYPIWGDGRYTPWIRKFAVFEATMLGICFFAATLFVVVTIDPPDRKRAAVVVCLLLLSAGLIYPVLFPASFGLVVLHLLFEGSERFRATGRSLPQGTIPLLLTSLACVAIWLGYVAFVRQAHGGSPSMVISDLWSMKVKLATAVVVLAPILLGLVLAARRVFREHRRAGLTLILASLGLTALYTAVTVLHYVNEYKYIFVVAICLVPLAVLGQMRLLQPLQPRMRPAAALLIALAMATPAVVAAWRTGSPPGPALDLSAFRLALAPSEPLADALRTVAHAAPLNAVLVSGPTLFDLAALTSRPIYVQADTTHETRGLGLTSDYLLKSVRGYPADLVDTRRATVDSLYTSPDTAARSRALRRISDDLARPLVVLLQTSSELALAGWLGTMIGATRLHTDSYAQAWLIRTPDPRR